MHVDADRLDPRQRRDPCIDFTGPREGNAELVLLLAGRDLGVRRRRSTSGLMRTDTGATLPIAAAISLSRSSSGSLSRLKHLMPSSSPRRISATVLPTPENTILLGRNARRDRPLQLAPRHHVGARALPLRSSSAPPGWNWPSSHRPPASGCPRTPRASPAHAGAASPPNTHRTAFRPCRPAPSHRRLRRTARRRDTGNDAPRTPAGWAASMRSATSACSRHRLRSWMPSSSSFDTVENRYSAIEPRKPHGRRQHVGQLRRRSRSAM